MTATVLFRSPRRRGLLYFPSAKPRPNPALLALICYSDRRQAGVVGDESGSVRMKLKAKGRDEGQRLEDGIELREIVRASGQEEWG